MKIVRSFVLLATLIKNVLLEPEFTTLLIKDDSSKNKLENNNDSSTFRPATFNTLNLDEHLEAMSSNNTGTQQNDIISVTDMTSQNKYDEDMKDENETEFLVDESQTEHYETTTGDFSVSIKDIFRGKFPKEEDLKGINIIKNWLEEKKQDVGGGIVELLKKGEELGKYELTPFENKIDETSNDLDLNRNYSNHDERSTEKPTNITDNETIISENTTEATTEFIGEDEEYSTENSSESTTNDHTFSTNDLDEIQDTQEDDNTFYKDETTTTNADISISINDLSSSESIVHKNDASQESMTKTIIKNRFIENDHTTMSYSTVMESDYSQETTFKNLDENIFYETESATSIDETTILEDRFSTTESSWSTSFFSYSPSTVQNNTDINDYYYESNQTSVANNLGVNKSLEFYDLDSTSNLESTTSFTPLKGNEDETQNTARNTSESADFFIEEIGVTTESIHKIKDASSITLNKKEEIYITGISEYLKQNSSTTNYKSEEIDVTTGNSNYSIHNSTTNYINEEIERTTENRDYYRQHFLTINYTNVKIGLTTENPNYSKHNSTKKNHINGEIDVTTSSYNHLKHNFTTTNHTNFEVDVTTDHYEYPKDNSTTTNGFIEEIINKIEHNELKHNFSSTTFKQDLAPATTSNINNNKDNQTLLTEESFQSYVIEGITSTTTKHPPIQLNLFNFPSKPLIDDNFDDVDDEILHLFKDELSSIQQIKADHFQTSELEQDNNILLNTQAEEDSDLSNTTTNPNSFTMETTTTKQFLNLTSEYNKEDNVPNTSKNNFINTDFSNELQESREQSMEYLKNDDVKNIDDEINDKLQYLLQKKNGWSTTKQITDVDVREMKVATKKLVKFLQRDVMDDEGINCLRINLTIQINIYNKSLIEVPSDAYLIGNCSLEEQNLKITWKSEFDNLNNSIYLKSNFEDNSSYITYVKIKLFQEKTAELIVQQKNDLKILKFNKGNETTKINITIPFQKNISMTFTNSSIKDLLYQETGERASLLEKHALVLQIASGSFCMFVILLVVSIFAYKKIKSKTRIFKITSEK